MPAPRITPTRILGSALLAFSAVPLHRLLTPASTGPAGTFTRASAEAAWASGLLGTLIVILLAGIVSATPATDHLRRATGRVATALADVPGRWFALGIGILAAGLGAMTAHFIHGGAPTSVDELVQLLHARALSGGAPTLPIENASASWAVQNGLFTAEGWASIYPPLHTVLLAGGLLAGVPWLLGPIAIGIATAAFSSGLDELLEDRRLARVSALLLAVSPFWLLLGSTYLSHSTAAAGACLVFCAAVRARNGTRTSFLLLGAAVGFTVCIRPWTGTVLSTAIISAVTLPDLLKRANGRLTALASLMIGGAPFAAFLFWWNTRLFGSPLALGYSAAFGPSHGLGLHTDPWGNTYGAMEALAYSGADVVQLNAHLLESPMVPLLVVGVGLVAGARYLGMWPLLAWGIAGVLGNALYWHHGVHMGPRMLLETAPAWIAATVCAGHALATPNGHAVRMRDAVAWALAIAFLGSLLLAPSVMLAQRAEPSALRASRPPVPPTSSAVVFVHGSWASRVSARLASSGMRRDSIETALRRNDICAVDAVSRARVNGAPTPTRLDLDPKPGSPQTLTTRSLSAGNTVRVDPSSPVTSSCAREARSDRFGAIELELLLWQRPPTPGAEVVLARDMGPAGNVPALQLYSHTPYVYLDGPDGPRLLPYDVGMELVWGGPAPPAEGAR